MIWILMRRSLREKKKLALIPQEMELSLWLIGLGLHLTEAVVAEVAQQGYMLEGVMVDITTVTAIEEGIIILAVV